MKVSIQRAATYAFPAEVRASIHYLRLTPQSSPRQKILKWELNLGAPAQIVNDPHGNLMQVLAVEGMHETIELSIRGEVEIDESCACIPDGGVSPLPYLRPTTLTTFDDDLAAEVRALCDGRNDREALLQLMQHLHEVLVVAAAAEKAAAQAEAAEQAQQQTGAGTSQQQAQVSEEAVVASAAASREEANGHAHAFIARARAVGVPARYAAGYLLDPEAGDLRVHGWAEAWFDGNWYSFDVSNNLGMASRHLKLAVGMDAQDACPVRGVSRSGGLMVSFDTCRINKLQKLG